MFGVMANALGVAINVGFYWSDPNPWSLGGAIVCGSMLLFCLIEATR